ncbi:MAG: hypothetical protein JZU55_02780 [Afipia sp.]|nr:hypothetical protein [Afipia sp.]
MSDYERRGAGYDSGASGYEMQGRELRCMAYEPIPAAVRYEAARDSVVYTPENYTAGFFTESPSDCLWIVPVGMVVAA